MADKAYHLHLKIFKLPKIITNDHKGWKALWGESKKWIGLIADAVITQGRPPYDPINKAHIRLTRVSCAWREPDADNLAASFKFVIDALVKNRIIVDDSPQHLKKCEFLWVKCPTRSGQHIEVELTEVLK